MPPKKTGIKKTVRRTRTTVRRTRTMKGGRINLSSIWTGIKKVGKFIKDKKILSTLAPAIGKLVGQPMLGALGGIALNKIGLGKRRQKGSAFQSGIIGRGKGGSFTSGKVGRGKGGAFYSGVRHTTMPVVRRPSINRNVFGLQSGGRLRVQTVFH